MVIGAGLMVGLQLGKKSKKINWISDLYLRKVK